MDSARIQQDVVAAVAERGYREGWSVEQFTGRQILKLIEELAEMLRHFRPSPVPLSWSGLYGWKGNFDSLAQACRRVFDQASPKYWEGLIIEHPGHLVWELYDLQVVLFNMADALGELIGPFDLALEARNKALQDVGRGVREEADS